MKKIHIIFIIFFSILIFSCGKDSKDKTAFETAEKVFNDGKIAEAKELYTMFTKDFPTSKWRQIAETQLTKCNQIVELEREAIRCDSSGEFNKAIEIYTKIASINQNAVDTTEIFKSIRLKILKHKEGIEQAFSESLLLAFLFQYVFNLLHFTNDVTVVLTNQNELGIKVNSLNLLDLERRKKITTGFDFTCATYNKYKNLQSKYAKLVTEIKQSFMTYDELSKWLNLNFGLDTIFHRLEEIDIKSEQGEIDSDDLFQLLSEIYDQFQNEAGDKFAKLDVDEILPRIDALNSHIKNLENYLSGKEQRQLRSIRQSK